MAMDQFEKAKETLRRDTPEMLDNVFHEKYESFWNNFSDSGLIPVLAYPITLRWAWKVWIEPDNPDSFFDHAYDIFRWALIKSLVPSISITKPDNNLLHTSKQARFTMGDVFFNQIVMNLDYHTESLPTMQQFANNLTLFSSPYVDLFVLSEWLLENESDLEERQALLTLDQRFTKLSPIFLSFLTWGIVRKVNNEFRTDREKNELVNRLIGIIEKIEDSNREINAKESVADALILSYNYDIKTLVTPELQQILEYELALTQLAESLKTKGS